MHELGPESAWEYATGGPWPRPGELLADEQAMAEAIRASLAGIGVSSPNPSVGCVLTQGGRVVGRGAHRRAGDCHAEVAAIRDAINSGESTIGATAYVTLEPCCHFGRTPPCTDALLQAGIKRVAVGIQDPNPRVAGGGMAILRARGVEVSEGILGTACAKLHAPFFKLIKTGLPWVLLKLALGSDGGIGLPGMRTNITSPETQMLAHSLRRASDGIIVGRNTIAVDDPWLTDRWPESAVPGRIFHRIVLDSCGTLSPACCVWQNAAGHASIRVLTEGAPPIDGAQDLRLPPGPGGCSLRHLLQELKHLGLCRLLVEGGADLAWQILQDGLMDVLHIFRSDAPAGGKIVALDGLGLGPPTKSVRFDGGCWEIWERQTWEPIAKPSGFAIQRSC